MKRRQHSDDLKAKAVIEAIKGEDTVNVIAKRYDVHPLLITKWKKHVISLLPTLFSRKPDKGEQDWETREAQLFQEIGKLKFELDWLKKKSSHFEQ
jgi:transposase-like protein